MEYMQPCSERERERERESGGIKILWNCASACRSKTTDTSIWGHEWGAENGMLATKDQYKNPIWPKYNCRKNMAIFDALF